MLQPEWKIGPGRLCLQQPAIHSHAGHTKIRRMSPFKPELNKSTSTNLVLGRAQGGGHSFIIIREVLILTLSIFIAL